MKIKYILGAMGMAFGMTGCNLDITMYDGVMEEQFDNKNLLELSQGSYRLLKNDGGLIDNGYYFWAFGADDVTWNGTSTGSTFKLYDYSRNIASSTTEYTWELGYRVIGNCNKIIEIIQGLGNESTREQTIMMGENYYLRALSYFLLVNEFAQPYSNNPTQNPGLPLKLTSDPNDLPQSRSTVAEVYDQVVLDLKDAITYLTLQQGETPKSNIYATKEAAEALLARVYLYMENWDGAWEMANKVITSGRFELERGNRFATYSQLIPEDNKETIFAVRRTLDKDDDGYSRMGSMYIRIDGSGWEEMSPSSRYLELLELHLNANDMPQDLRSKFIVKRYVEDGVADYTPVGYPNNVYEDWTFAYAVKQANTANYEYKQLDVEKQADGTFLITKDASKFQSATIQEEAYNTGTRYYVVGQDGNKYIGRIEPKVFDASTKRGKSSLFLVYAINNRSYQEQSKHLWSPIISRLAEMYLIRAEANYEKGGSVQATLDDINILRERAGIPEWTMENIATAESGNPKDVHKIIEEERMLELGKVIVVSMYSAGAILWIEDIREDIPLVRVISSMKFHITLHQYVSLFHSFNMMLILTNWNKKKKKNRFTNSKWIYK